MQKIFRAEDFKAKGLSHFNVLMPGHKQGETEEEYRARYEKGIAECGVDPFMESDEPLDLFNVIRKDGRYYSVGMSGRDYGLVHDEADFNEEGEPAYDEDKLVCPFCGEEIDDVYEPEDDYSCPNCGGTFDIEVSLCYSTTPKDAPKIIDM